MEAPAQIFYALIAVAALGVALGILYPQLASIQHIGQPRILEVHVLRIADINGTVHILVELEPHEPVWLEKWCLGGHCYAKLWPVIQPMIEDLIDVDHAYNPGAKLVVCYRETWEAPTKCVSLHLP